MDSRPNNFALHRTVCAFGLLAAAAAITLAATPTPASAQASGACEAARAQDESSN